MLKNGRIRRRKLRYQSDQQLYNTYMKSIRYLALGALALAVADSPAFALKAIPPSPTLFDFQYVSTSPTTGFAPTSVQVLVPAGEMGLALPDSAIVNYQITTPEGVWTPAGFAPILGPDSGTPFFVGGGVEVDLNGNLIFTGTVNIEAQEDTISVQSFVANPFYDVQLTTTSVSDTTTFSPAPSDANGSTGNWIPVVAVPEISDTFVLLLVSAASLGVYHRFQSSPKDQIPALVPTGK
jgi:hypothetical protein